MKLGLFGGSFDPIHRGHIDPVQAARRELGLDRVIYLPTAVPPHKPGRILAPAHARYTMVEMALLDEEGLYASTFELTLGRPAYTVETLEHFRRTVPAMPETELVLIIGGDSYAELDHWVRWEEIPDLARLAVLTRPGWTLEESSLSPELAALARSGKVDFLHQPPVDISSTRLRELFSKGGAPPPGTVPESVVRYVHKYDLYR
ncbi:MAG TPA: nicotinate (nicotinamide) nucleotide adenylyltransferase [Thermoanaerobaculia bacterium]|jgi:nicotinate-nucleotide adenylyltransferase|nr:nicotinate (nicotinamide) nucleotide adenylyltransferase [Thermoanaerobaculia bacterium]